MEKINCNVIQDILPLYIDDVVSDDTKELVEEHLQNCERQFSRVRRTRKIPAGVLTHGKDNNYQDVSVRPCR